MAQRSIRDHLDHLPLFPLPGVVLFPSMRMPLHIFEPRYRALVEDARRDGLPIAMGHIREEALTPGSATRGDLVPGNTAPVHPILGAGFIDAFEALPDGRFLIVLLGAARVRLVGEKQTSLPYRIVRGELVEDSAESPSENQQAVDAFRRVLLALHRVDPKAASALSAETLDLQGAGPIADAVAGLLQTDPNTRQAWLAETRAAVRLHAVTEALESLLATPGSGRGTVH